MSTFDDQIREIVRAIVRDELQSAIKQAKGDEYLSTRAAAQLADVTEGTVRRWIRAGRLPEHRAGKHGKIRILRSELEAVLRSGARAENDESPEALARRDFG